MSKTKRFTKPSLRKQKGAALIESLIGMLILSIAVLGSMLALAQSMRLQHVNGIRAQVIDHLRGQLLEKGATLCSTNLPMQIRTHAMSAAFECTPYTNVVVSVPGASPVSVAAAANEAQVITARVNSPLLGGVLTVTSSR